MSCPRASTPAIFGDYSSYSAEYDETDGRPRRGASEGNSESAPRRGGRSVRPSSLAVPYVVWMAVFIRRFPWAL